MKILWICNIILPVIARQNNLPAPVTGGWLTALSENLSSTNGFDLIISFPSETEISGIASDIQYHSFNHKTSYVDILSIIRKHNPDVIHIFGTEYSHSLDAINASIAENKIDSTIIHIQGLISVCSRHYYCNLPSTALYKQSLRDFIKCSSIKKTKQSYAKNGLDEIEAIQKAKHISGRTDWDYACSKQMNPDSKYHFCNETLRSEFYKHKWSPNDCEKHSIFISQCSYPIKGFHLALEALKYVVKQYPDTVLYTTGRKQLSNYDFKNRFSLTYYELYILKLIKKYGLENNVKFLGSLGEKEMCDRFLRSQVFISASSIENSPNSVCEAMLLGVPTVSSNVGGVSSILTHSVDGFLYQWDAPYMLASYICKLFSDKELSLTFSENSRKHAHNTHNRQKNLETIIKIYKEIGEKN